jgi:hypothetical protein
MSTNGQTRAYLKLSRYLLSLIDCDTQKIVGLNASAVAEPGKHSQRRSPGVMGRPPIGRCEACVALITGMVTLTYASALYRDAELRLRLSKLVRNAIALPSIYVRPQNGMSIPT